MGTALLFAEKEFFDDEKATKAARKAQKAEKHKRTAQEVNLPGAACPLKRAAVSSIRQMTKNDPPSRPSQPVISQSNEGVDGDTNRSSDEESDGDEGETVHANAPDQISTEPAGSLEALLQVAIKEKSAEFHTTSSKWRKRDLDPMIDYLINTERYNCIGCRRWAFDVCFDNAAAGGKFLHMRLQCTDSFKCLPQTQTTLSVTPTVLKGALAAISCSQLFAVIFTTHLHSLHLKLTSLTHHALPNGSIPPNTCRWSKIVRLETPSTIGKRTRPQLYLAGLLSTTLGRA